MAHYPIADLLKRAFNRSVVQGGITAEELRDWQKSRRRFLKQLTIAAGGLAFLPACMQVAAPPRIAIIGAGIAGLNAAWQLQKQGVIELVAECGP